MDYSQVKDMQARFDNRVRRVPGETIEFWYARDLQELLGYESWTNFSIALRRAISACDPIEYYPTDHFRHATRAIKLGDGVESVVEDFMLTRYACYLIAWQGDSHRMTMVFAQSYFAIQTRKQKLVNDRMRLQALIDAQASLCKTRQAVPAHYERDADDEGFMRLRLRTSSALLDGVQDSRQTQSKNGEIKQLAHRMKRELGALLKGFLTIN